MTLGQMVLEKEWLHGVYTIYEREFVSHTRGGIVTNRYIPRPGQGGEMTGAYTESQTQA